MNKSYAELVYSFKELLTAHALFCRASVSDIDSASARYTSLRCYFSDNLRELYEENERLNEVIKNYGKKSETLKELKNENSKCAAS